MAGIPEVVKDNETGLLAPPATCALADALARWWPTPDCTRLARRRRVQTPRFGVDGYVASLTKIYDTLIAEKQTA